MDNPGMSNVFMRDSISERVVHITLKELNNLSINCVKMWLLCFNNWEEDAR